MHAAEIADQSQFLRACAPGNIGGVAHLASHHGIGGCSFVQCAETDTDYEIYFDVRIDNEPLSSPNVNLDAVIDFVGNAAADIPRLVAEVCRLRALTSSR